MGSCKKSRSMQQGERNLTRGLNFFFLMSGGLHYDVILITSERIWVETVALLRYGRFGLEFVYRLGSLRAKKASCCAHKLTRKTASTSGLRVEYPG